MGRLRCVLLGVTNVIALECFREGRAPYNATVDNVWTAKRQYSSAFHPDTGELMFLPGRMSFQVPGNMVITGLMMTFYR